MKAALCLLIVLCALGLARSQSFDAVSNDLETLASIMPNVYGAAIVTQNTKGNIRVSTGAAGLSNPLTGAQMMTDTSINGNALGELFVAMLAVNLSKRSYLPLLDQSIDSSLLPCPLVNPYNLGSYLTLRRLLTHTSGLGENQLLFQTVSGSSVSSLRSFAQTYFSVQGPTGATCASGLFQQSLAAGTYSYSRANILLVSFIIEMVISSNLALVQGSQKNIGTMLQEAIFNTLGLSGTYFVLPDGSNPRRGALLGERSMQQFDAKAVQEMSTPTSAAATSLFAPYTTGFMLRTTASDLAKVTRSLFLDTSGVFYSVGQTLQAFINATDAGRPGMVQQGLGIVGIDSKYVCAQGIGMLSLSAGCSLALGSTLIGFATTGQTSAVSSLCAASAGTTTCVSAVVAYSRSSTSSRSFQSLDIATSSSSANVLYAMTTSAANNALISPLLSQGQTITVDDQTTTPLFGFEVFIAIFLSFIGVLTLAYFAEYFIQPVPLVGHLSSKAYPTLSEHIDRSMNAISQ